MSTRTFGVRASKNQGPPCNGFQTVILTVTRTNVTILTRLFSERYDRNGNAETCFSADDERACKRDAPEVCTGCQKFPREGMNSFMNLPIPSGERVVYRRLLHETIRRNTACIINKISFSVTSACA